MNSGTNGISVEQLTAFYGTHDPSKVALAPLILQQYGTEELVQALREKYGTAPQPALAASGSPFGGDADTDTDGDADADAVSSPGRLSQASHASTHSRKNRRGSMVLMAKGHELDHVMANVSSGGGSGGGGGGGIICASC